MSWSVGSARWLPNLRAYRWILSQPDRHSGDQAGGSRRSDRRCVDVGGDTAAAALVPDRRERSRYALERHRRGALPWRVYPLIRNRGASRPRSPCSHRRCAGGFAPLRVRRSSRGRGEDATTTSFRSLRDTPHAGLAGQLRGRGPFAGRLVAGLPRSARDRSLPDAFGVPPGRREAPSAAGAFPMPRRLFHGSGSRPGGMGN